MPWTTFAAPTEVGIVFTLFIIVGSKKLNYNNNNRSITITLPFAITMKYNYKGIITFGTKYILRRILQLLISLYQMVNVL